MEIDDISEKVEEEPFINKMPLLHEHICLKETSRRDTLPRRENELGGVIGGEDEEDPVGNFIEDLTIKKREKRKKKKKMRYRTIVMGNESKWRQLKGKMTSKKIGFTSNTPEDFSAIGEIMHHKKMLWNDPIGIDIMVTIFYSNHILISLA